MAEESTPEEDMEIIDPTLDHPTDPNTNNEDNELPLISTEDNINDEEQSGDVDMGVISLQSSIQSPDVPIDALEDIQHEQDNIPLDQFLVEDPTNTTQPTDTTAHDRTLSTDAGAGFLSFFNMGGDDGGGDDDAPDEIEPASKRGQSMGGIDTLDYDTLQILNDENLQKFNENTLSRDSGDENDIDEEKQAQPQSSRIDADDGHSNKSARGSSGSQQDDLNPEQHNQDLANQPDDEQPARPLIDTTNPVQDEMDNIQDSGMPLEYGDPGQGYIPEDTPEDKPTGRGRSGTTVVHDDDPMDNRMSVQNVMDTLEEEENLPGNDDDGVNVNETGSVRSYDIERNSNSDIIGDGMGDGIGDGMDDVLEEPPKHQKRKSIADMIEQDPEIMNLQGQIQQSQSIGNMEDMMNDDNIYGSDEDGMGQQMAEEANWMEISKKWMMKEKQLKEEIMDLQDDLDKADQQMRDMQIDHEKRISRLEEDRNILIQDYEDKIENLTQDNQITVEKLSNDNVTLARDVKFLNDEVDNQKQRITDLEGELEEARQDLQNKENEWNMHQDQCPLLNQDIAKEIEDKRAAEIRRYQLGSQQMDASLGKMVQENKDLEDERDEMKERLATQNAQIEQRNVEIDKLREELEKIKASNNKNRGALDELRMRADEEQRKRLDLEQEYQRLGNEYDMLMAYSNEQAQVLDMAEFAPTGVDPQKFQAVKNKKQLFVNPRGSQSRSIVQSMGGLSEFADHMRSLSNISDAIRSGAAVFQSDMKEEYESEATPSEQSFATQTTDIGTIASNFTRYSFQRYHTHDASREFFFLLSLCVKLNLANKYGVSPDIAPNNDNLWKQALANNIKFHEYYDFLYNELTNLYEYKYRTRQGRIQNVVITDVTKIRQLKHSKEEIRRLNNIYDGQSYIYNQYENYTKGTQSVENQLQNAKIKDRTLLSPNDDFFGGNVKITSRAQRNKNLESHRSSQSSKRSSKHRLSGVGKSPRSDRHKRRSKSGRHSSSHRHSGSRRIGGKDQEPGTDKHHPLNMDESEEKKRRGSQKLSHLPPNHNQSGSQSSRSPRSPHSQHSQQNGNINANLQ